jgi:hypothetical protein
MTEQAPALADYRDLSALYEHWVARFDDAAIPDWSNFDAVELKPWLGRLNLVAVEHDDHGARRFVYRVFATDLAQALDCEMTGREVGDGAPGVCETLIEDYAEVVDTAHPILRRHKMSHRSRVLPHVRLMLPLGDGGDEVTRILVGVHPLWVPVRTPLISGLPPEIDPDVIFGAHRLQAGA